MRRAFFVFLMAATAATPLASASAARPDREDRQQARAERQEQRSERREQRVERRAERPAQVRQQSYAPPQQSTARPERVQRVERPQIAQARNWQDRRGDRVRSDRGNREIAPVRNVQQTRQWSGNNGNSQWNRNRGGDGNWDRNRSGNWNGDRNNSRSGNWNGSRSHSQNWNRSWRNDHRYDWRNYRNSNRGRYHLSHYYSPYRGWGYQRFSIGLFLEPLFYSNNYWIGDPGYYRLPPAYPGTRWVRYYDDVLLVDLYSGEVIDVIYDFFW